MQPKWWQTAVFYQIYPRSFANSTGDGVGDLGGIMEKLDDLRDLGIDALWLSPLYPSPLYDCGYDVADYTGIAPEYGTMDDFRRFLQEAHDRDIRVILDLVLNHTSHEHPWFRASRVSRDHPKRDWYVWHDPAPDGGPPNNWGSSFGGSAWEYDALTDQYFYHFFLKEQPDLNWRNPEVKQAVFDEIRVWLEMGVDGFRLDAIDTIFEHPDMPDHDADYTQSELIQAFKESGLDRANPELMKQWAKMFAYQVRQPGIHALFKDLRALIDEYDDRMLVGETSDVAYYGEGDDELHLAFNFPLMRTDELTPTWIRQNQEARLGALPEGAWPCNTLGNHDGSRVYTHFGDGEHDDELARLSLALMLTLRGTPFLYNGEEIGMTDYLLEDITDFKDLVGMWFYHLHRDVAGLPKAQALVAANRLGRDKCRTPLQWANAPHGGFCPPDVDPWLPVNPNYAEGVNVADQKDDPDSMLSFYRQMLAMRRETPALVLGGYEPLHEDAEDYLAFLRTTDDQACLVVLNYSDEAHTLAFDLEGADTARLVFSSRDRPAEIDLSELTITPFEIIVAERRENDG
jgi:alpha-glucosidase